MEKSIEVHNLTVSYHSKPVLWDVDFSLPTGKIIGIVGPNGSGKTTMLKTIMGLMKPDSGYTEIFGEPLDKVRSRVSYVPQRESVDWDFPADVMDVVLMGRYRKNNLFRRISTEDKRVATEALEKVNLLEFAHRQISQLSGGQQQRVFIARSILQLLQEMKNQGKTVVIVHHDLQTANEYFDHIVLLNTRLVAAGPKDKVFTKELLQEAYGGRLTVLSKLGDLISTEEFPLREPEFKENKPEKE